MITDDELKLTLKEVAMSYLAIAYENLCEGSEENHASVHVSGYLCHVSNLETPGYEAGMLIAASKCSVLLPVPVN
jgi:hypothetical protein